MLKKLFFLCAILIFFEVCDGVDQAEISLSYYYSSGITCSDYHDSASLLCASCPNNQEADPESIGGNNLYGSCRCDAGYANVENDCTGVCLLSHALNQ